MDNKRNSTFRCDTPSTPATRAPSLHVANTIQVACFSLFPLPYAARYLCFSPPLDTVHRPSLILKSFLPREQPHMRTPLFVLIIDVTPAKHRLPPLTQSKVGKHTIRGLRSVAARCFKPFRGQNHRKERRSFNGETQPGGMLARQSLDVF